MNLRLEAAEGRTRRRREDICHRPLQHHESGSFSCGCGDEPWRTSMVSVCACRGRWGAARGFFVADLHYEDVMGRKLKA